MIKENLNRVQENIRNACARAGRKEDEVTLIAVSKTKPVSMLEAVSYTHLDVYKRQGLSCIWTKK